MATYSKNNAIAIGTGNLIYGNPMYKPKEKTLSQDTVNDALEVAEDYLSYNMITQEEFDKANEDINSAESDDELSGIMCRLRHKAYATYERRCVYA